MRSADSTFKVKLVCFSFLDFSLDKTRISFLLAAPFIKLFMNLFSIISIKKREFTL